MAILEKEVWIGLNHKNIDYYENLGYKIPRSKDNRGRRRIDRKEKILVKINDLLFGSNAIVTKICDCCGIRKKLRYNQVSRGRKQQKDGLDRCHKCSTSNNGSRLCFATLDNCIANTDKEFAKVFFDNEDTYKYKLKSSKKVDFKCPDCGGKVKNKKISNVYNQGLSCPNCSDKLSYPEKFMFNLLTQLGTNFETQKCFDWSEGRRYDFYINSLKCIIETHGRQHYDNKGFEWCGGRTLEEEINNDKHKKYLAHKNGIYHYIIIDCSKSNIDFMRNSITNNSLLMKLRNIENINWYKCNEYAQKSIVKEVCELWDAGIKDTKKISDLMKINRSTVIDYLKRGADAEWCNYSVEVSRRIGQSNRENKKIIQSTREGIIVDEFVSVKDAERNTGIKSRNIYSVCKGIRPLAGGFKWMYKENYEKYIASQAI